MASAIPVPGQPGRLFIPGRIRSKMPRARAKYETKKVAVDEGHMTISEVSTQDLEDYERDSMNGLGATTATAVAKPVAAKPATTALAPTQKPLAGDDLVRTRMELAQKSKTWSDDELKALITAMQAGTSGKMPVLVGVEQTRTTKDLSVADVQRLAPAVDALIAELDSRSIAGKFKEWMKQPWYWPVVIGGGALIAYGAYKWWSGRTPVRQVAAVETLGLEGVKAPKRRKSRRKSRKSKA